MKRSVRGDTAEAQDLDHLEELFREEGKGKLMLEKSAVDEALADIRSRLSGEPVKISVGKPTKEGLRPLTVVSNDLG